MVVVKGPRGIARAVTRKITTETRVEFDATELRRRLRLPEDAKVLVESHFSMEESTVVSLESGEVKLVATWTVSK